MSTNNYIGSATVPARIYSAIDTLSLPIFREIKRSSDKQKNFNIYTLSYKIKINNSYLTMKLFHMFLSANQGGILAGGVCPS